MSAEPPLRTRPAYRLWAATYDVENPLTTMDTLAVQFFSHDIAGKDLANPTAALFALCSMLIYLSEVDTGEKLKAAILECIGEGKSTKDLGGPLGTAAFTEAVIQKFHAKK